jgi:flavin reductase (DIM6/NTAB) family NADH-FMN oxidoreductase RutF
MAAPGGHGAIGPFPPRVADDDAGRDEYDRLRRRVLRSMPYGLYVVGSRAGDRRNGMTLNWATQLAFEPKLVGIGVETTAFTYELIRDGGVFALCLIAREDRAIVRKFTKPVDVDEAARTLNGFAYHDGVSGAPILDLAVGYLDCEVRHEVPCGQHALFIGEIVDAGFQRPEDTELLRMEDTRMDYGG